MRDRADLRVPSTRVCSQAIDSPLFHDGTWTLTRRSASAATGTNADLVACAWRKGSDFAVVAANITATRRHRDSIDFGDRCRARTFELKDPLSDSAWNGRARTCRTAST
jgi:hypothetical protein